MNRTLLPGHGLVRQKGMFFHVGTYLGSNQVAHVSPQGLRIDSIEVFANGQQIEIIGRPVRSDLLQQRLQEAMRLHSAYDPFFQNCEHLSNFLQKGLRESPQLKGVVIGLSVATGIIANSRMHPAASLATALFCTWAGVRLMRPTGTTPAARASRPKHHHHPKVRLR